MSNTIKTLQAGDITRKALSILHNNLVFCKSINREYDSRFAVTGQKNGGYLQIREPNQFTVRTGAVMDTQDVTERTQELVVATQKGVDINFSTSELTLSLDDFASRILEPAMTRLAADVDATVIDGTYPYVPKLVNTAFGTKPTLADVLLARASLQQGLAPTSNRILLTDSLAANSIITDGKSIYNPAGEISRQYSTGLMGMLYGFKHYESEMTPVHTNGSRTDATPVVDISTISNGDTTITTTGQTSSQTLKVGDVFTIADVYEVNPETKESTGALKQFSIKTDLTADGTDVFAITWPIYKSGPYQNAYAAAWTGSKAIVHVAAGGSGTASASLRHSLAYHKDAFTFVTADLEMPQGQDFAYRANIDNISMRLVRDFDIVNDKFPCRIDVLFGYKCIRPEWAVRVVS
jgi:hypothetical protein